MEISKSTIDKNGRVLIPCHFRKHFGLKIGEKVILCQEGDELKIKVFKESLTKARQIVKQHNKNDLDLVSLLLQDRREEN